MSRFIERLRELNAQWNDLPRRLMWILVLFLCLFLCLTALPYVLPFALAALFAWVINPLVTWVQKRLGGKKIWRNIASAILVILLTSTVVVLVTVLIGRIFKELGDLASVLPGWINTASRQVIDWIENIELDWPVLENGLDQMLLRMVSDLTSLVATGATRIASTVARSAWQFVGFLPQGILFVVLTLMGTYYMSADKERIFSFLRGILPEKKTERVTVFRTSIFKAIFGQLRAAIVMMIIIFGELAIGFLIIGLDYAILLALIIAVLDALPVIGAGLFLLPMCAIGFVTGNTALGIGAGLLYLLTIVIRQLMEPRLIGRQLGLYPLATMMAMYAGFVAMGFIGMLLGPIMLLLCKVALTAAEDVPVLEAPAAPEPGPLKRPLKKRSKK